MQRLPIALQNTYSDLLSRLQDEQVALLQDASGAFVSKTIKQRRYWYFQAASFKGSPRKQTYVGPETPELLERIAKVRELTERRQERRELVRALTQSRAVPQIPAAVGNVLAALADSGVFRLRAVLVGTVAFQTYAAMLGIRLGANSFATEDIDVAQFRSISIAVDDTTPDVIETLRKIDPKFHPVGTLDPKSPSASYVGGGVKVEFLTPMRGPNEDTPANLKALGTGAQPLRFLDYLIYREHPAAVLHGSGILVNVPDPVRYAWHKLLVSQRRSADRAKSRKDILQAQTLFDALVGDQASDVREIWDELAGPGRKQWQELALLGLKGVSTEVRSRLLALIDRAS